MDNHWNFPMLKAQFRSKFWTRKLLIFIIFNLFLVSLAAFYVKREAEKNYEAIHFSDLVVSILSNSYIQLMFFLPFFLVFIHEICEEWSGKANLLVRFGSRYRWITHLIIVAVSFAFMYTIIFLGTIVLTSYFIVGGSLQWGMVYTRGIQASFSAEMVFYMLAVRYLFSTLVISSIFLLTYRFASRKKTIAGILVSMVIILGNHLLHFSFLQRWVPFLSFTNQYISGFKPGITHVTDIFLVQWALIAFICFSILILLITVDKMQFSE